MAKVRLDWFKLDCQLDSKFRLIESEFGLKGFAIVVKLFQMIYGGEGYYCDWDEDIVLVFAKDNDVSAGTVSEIVSRAISRGIFDKGMFEKYGILTSHGIQTRYSEAVGRRKFSNIKSEYLLLRNTQKSENADISSENVSISSENVNISSAEKNRKEKNRIDKNRRTEPHNFSVVSLSDEERAELDRLSDSLSVEIYIKKIVAWQQENRKMCSKPFITIKNWIEEDQPKKKPDQGSQSKDTSYDLNEWERMAMNFDPEEGETGQ